MERILTAFILACSVQGIMSILLKGQSVVLQPIISIVQDTDIETNKQVSAGQIQNDASSFQSKVDTMQKHSEQDDVPHKRRTSIQTASGLNQISNTTTTQADNVQDALLIGEMRNVARSVPSIAAEPRATTDTYNNPLTTVGPIPDKMNDLRGTQIGINSNPEQTLVAKDLKESDGYGLKLLEFHFAKFLPGGYDNSRSFRKRQLRYYRKQFRHARREHRWDFGDFKDTKLQRTNMDENHHRLGDNIPTSPIQSFQPIPANPHNRRGSESLTTVGEGKFDNHKIDSSESTDSEKEQLDTFEKNDKISVRTRLDEGNQYVVSCYRNQFYLISIILLFIMSMAGGEYLIQISDSHTEHLNGNIKQ